jgi:hypothetical protein
MAPPNLALLKTLAGLILVGVLCASSTLALRKEITWSSAFQLAGACFLLVVIASHICEALHLLPWMNWGAANSADHYLDLVSTIAGVTLLLFGLLLRVIKIAKWSNAGLTSSNASFALSQK